MQELQVSALSSLRFLRRIILNIFRKFTLYGKKVKTVDFFETIAASDLKQIDLIRICEY